VETTRNYGPINPNERIFHFTICNQIMHVLLCPFVFMFRMFVVRYYVCCCVLLCVVNDLLPCDFQNNAYLATVHTTQQDMRYIPPFEQKPFTSKKSRLFIFRLCRLFIIRKITM